MIVFDLRCPKSHVFEGWFRDSAAFEAQSADGDLACPVCGSHDIVKALMAPNIQAKSNARRAPAPIALTDEPASEVMATTPAMTPGEGPSPEVFAAAMKALRALHQDIEKNCDYVGTDFADEARRMHRGESDKRGIYGETTRDEAESLADEGIEVANIPWVPRADG